MRILQVTPRYPPRTGGVEIHVSELSRRLVDRGHEVTVITADAGGDGDRHEERDGVEIRRFRSLAPGGAVHVCPQVATAVRRSDAEVVHAHNYHSLPVLFAAMGVGDRRFVVTPHYHGGSAHPVLDRLLSGYRLPGGWALRRADEVIAVSEWEREQLRADFGVEASVIPNGLDVDRFADATPEGRSRRYLLCVGRLVEYKGIQHAVRALTALPEYDLVVAGDGPYRASLEGLAAEHGVDDRITFLGYVSDERLPGLYAGASVYLNLSTREAYGMTVAEALAAGTPSVVRAAGALVEWTGARGTVPVSAIEPEAVSSAIREAGTLDPSPSLPTWDDVCADILDQYATDDASTASR